MIEKLVNKETYICLKRDKTKIEKSALILNEHHMQIIVNEEHRLAVMCTEEYLEELVLGRLLTEGLIRSEEDVWELNISEDGKLARVSIEDRDSRCYLKKVQAIGLSDDNVFAMADKMAEGMPLHEATWGAHSCFLFKNGKPLFACEDIGRHNAMDKVIGHALKHEINLEECAVYSSGRVPSDMAEKAIRAGIPVLASKGVPTKEAVELANTHKLTLICGARSDQMKIYTDFRKKGIDTLILAGGKSSRMGGKHKGNLKIGKETFTEHLINEFAKVSDKIWVSYGADIHETYAECEIVMDYYKNCGPMGGLHAGLTEATSDYVFVIACDMPFMSGQFVEELKKYLSDEMDVVVPLVDGRMHPLAAIYKKSVLPVVKELLENGNYKLRSIYENVRVSYVEIEDVSLQKMLRNINTLEEYVGIHKS